MWKNRKVSCLRLKSMEIEIPSLLVKISIFIAILTWKYYKILKKQDFFCQWIEKLNSVNPNGTNGFLFQKNVDKSLENLSLDYCKDNNIQYPLS